MNKHVWLDRYPLAHSDHAGDLERDAAILEFGPDRMERTAAEDEAHRRYVVQQREKAAAHHLAGMKIGQASGDMEAAKRHGAMYKLHLKALGHDPYDRPPPHIEQASRQQGGGPAYRFRQHDGDVFAVQDEDKKES